jgi:hypothetical protein
LFDCTRELKLKNININENFRDYDNETITNILLKKTTRRK